MDEASELPLETPETALIELSTEASALLGLTDAPKLDLTKLPDRLDDQLLSQVRAIAEAPLPVFASCDREHFDKSMKALSILPRKADDEVKGALRLELYWRKLQGHPREAISYLVEQGLDEFDWFPSIHQCKELLARWSAPRRAETWRIIARRKIEAELDARWRDLCWQVKLGKLTEEQINALPERTKRRLDNEGLIIGTREEPFEPIIYRLRPSVRNAAA